jgi:hypothetical protein
VARALAMWDDGLSAGQIARRIGNGCTKSALIGYARRNRWPSRAAPIIRLNPNGDGSVWTGPTGNAHSKVRKPVRAIPAPPKAPVEPPPRFRTCQWPTTSGRPWRFCDAPTVKGGAWCAEHHARCYHRYAPQRLEAA